MELSELCREINNWFCRSVYLDEFTIEDGKLDIAEGELTEGQYFRIVGSVFNDGVYQYPAVNLTDETFDGAVWAMAVPKEILSLRDEINTWESKYGEAIASPYQSESFGGYSYSMGTGADGGRGATWQNVYANRLNRWRKL